MEQKTVYYVGDKYQILQPNFTAELVANNPDHARTLLKYRREISRLVLNPDLAYARDLARALRDKEMGPEHANIPILLLTPNYPQGFEGIENVQIIPPDDVGIGDLSNIVLRESTVESP
ncbi:MAG: hypothetical protein IH934_02950 [Nanoarchaeota archaeon]|nr:hypothetical protein [Nanoarchaeota archaeon]